MTERTDLAVLRQWWLDNASNEADRTIPKAIEYGSGDLAEIGFSMGRILGRDLEHQQAVELGIFFYLYGKIARWEQAIRDGREISLDTIFDARVYAGMALRNRAVGGWPFNPDDPTSGQDQ